MTAAIQSPADMVNYALRRVGYPLRVGSLFDGSKAAKVALDIYGQARDDLLRKSDWGFAERNVQMTLLKSAPVGGYIPPTTWNPATNPPVGWLFEYAYPIDCLRVRTVRPTPFFFPVMDPNPYVWSVENDNYFTPPKRVILCNVANGLLVYTGQVTDPTSWDIDFVETLADVLGKPLAAGLTSVQEQQLDEVDEQREMMTAGDKER